MYALYKGDTFIDLGTKQYLAKLINVKVSSIEFYMTPTYKNRTKNGWIVIKIEDDEEENIKNILDYLKEYSNKNNINIKIEIKNGRGEYYEEFRKENKNETSKL